MTATSATGEIWDCAPSIAIDTSNVLTPVSMLPQERQHPR
jgi:hypothetical protein